MSSLGSITGYDDPELEDLIDKQDIVILQPKDGWIAPYPVPDEWNWNGKTLDLSRETFSSSSDILKTFDFPTATFAGCPSLEAKSSRDFTNAVKTVCKGCTKVTVVHNRDLVVTLLNTFRCVVELVLPHNLRLQNPLTETKLTSNHSLKVLKGDMCGIGSNHLLMDQATILSLINQCPQLEHLDTNLDELLELVPALFISLGNRKPFTTAQLNNCILGSFRHRVTLGNIVVNSGANFYCLNLILSCSRRRNRLEIVTGSTDVVAMIPSFENVTSLFIQFVRGRFSACPYKSCFPKALKKFRLSALELRIFIDVRLSEIAQHGSQLESLSLIDCWIVDEKLKPGTFEKLKVLGVGNEIAFNVLGRGGLSEVMFSRLIQRCSSLNELHVSGQELCCIFLKRSFKKSNLVNLKKLVLWTKQSLAGLKVGVSDLEALKTDLVSLECVITDSFDIRLFFQVYAQDVRLKWLSCTRCVAELAAVNGTDLVTNNFFADVV
ncbi:uncharacterized protein LOC135401766 [Ornithodoros turicata]|uniref:uncharacterized protein LOC135401766 n=1 Tax=Ornithodoros turicata TaxID=34597 RepID=UPI00313A32E0